MTSLLDLPDDNRWNLGHADTIRVLERADKRYREARLEYQVAANALVESRREYVRLMAFEKGIKCGDVVIVEFESGQRKFFFDGIYPGFSDPWRCEFISLRAFTKTGRPSKIIDRVSWKAIDNMSKVLNDG